MRLGFGAHCVGQALHRRAARDQAREQPLRRDHLWQPSGHLQRGGLLQRALERADLALRHRGAQPRDRLGLEGELLYQRLRLLHELACILGVLNTDWALGAGELGNDGPLARVVRREGGRGGRGNGDGRSARVTLGEGG